MFKLKRTHTCGELRAASEGREVRLNGWVDRQRDHGGLVFVDLRDRTGRTQVVFREENKALREQASGLKSEWVIAVRGTVRKRSAETVNPKMSTGEIEMEATELEILNESKTPPFEIRDERFVEVQMTPLQVVPTEQLFGRANALRNDSRVGLLTPMPNAPISNASTDGNASVTQPLPYLGNGSRPR